jgi:hypothetical protein
MMGAPPLRPSPRPRASRVLVRRLSLGVGAALAGLLLLGLVTSVTAASSSVGVAVWVEAGQIIVKTWNPRGPVGQSIGSGLFLEWQLQRPRFFADLVRTPAYTMLFVPIWMPLLAALIPAMLASLARWRRPGVCQVCGYELRGLRVAAGILRCPECSGIDTV